MPLPVNTSAVRRFGEYSFTVLLARCAYVNTSRTRRGEVRCGFGVVARTRKPPPRRGPRIHWSSQGRSSGNGRGSSKRSRPGARLERAPRSGTRSAPRQAHRTLLEDRARRDRVQLDLIRVGRHHEASRSRVRDEIGQQGAERVGTGRDVPPASLDGRGRGHGRPPRSPARGRGPRSSAPARRGTRGPGEAADRARRRSRRAAAGRACEGRRGPARRPPGRERDRRRGSRPPAPRDGEPRESLRGIEVEEGGGLQVAALRAGHVAIHQPLEDEPLVEGRGGLGEGDRGGDGRRGRSAAACPWARAGRGRGGCRPSAAGWRAGR